MYVLGEELLERDCIRGGGEAISRCSRLQDGSQTDAEDNADNCSDDSEECQRYERLDECEPGHAVLAAPYDVAHKPFQTTRVRERAPSVTVMVISCTP